MGQGPWAFDKNLVVLRKLLAGEDPLTISLDECDFFVHAMGMPLMMVHHRMAEVLGNAMGKFSCMDNSHEKGFLGSTLRFRVTIDITKPIRRMIQVTGPDGQEITVQLAYERLPNFCYYCGLIGHLVKDCHDCFEIIDDRGEVPVDKLAYGEWLRTHANAHHAKFVNGSLAKSWENLQDQLFRCPERRPKLRVAMVKDRRA